MPRVQVFSPDGFAFSIDTRNIDMLRAWFDEVLPWAHIDGRPGIDNFRTLWPRIQIHPMWAWQYGAPADPDWLCDTRVIGRLHDFPASDGETGLKALAALRRELERELAEGSSDG